MTRPNFFIVGAPKCGTTALSEYLREHNNVFMCTPKEPHYFATDLPKYRAVSSDDEYLELFSAANDVHHAIGEASATYLYSKYALSNIKDFSPDARIIVMLRNPLDLVYSMHSQLVFSKDEDEIDFIKAWELIEQRKNGKQLPNQCRDSKLLYYDEIAKLGDQLEKLMLLFPKNQIKIIFSEDFFKNTSEVYQEVLQFLQLNDDNRNTFRAINQNKYHKFEWLGSLTQRPPKKIANIVLGIKKYMGIERIGFIEAIRKVNVKKIQRRPLPIEFKKKIINRYHEDIVKLSEITGRNLDNWMAQK